MINKLLPLAVVVWWVLLSGPVYAQQCPNPPPPAPVLDGNLDLAYSQGGFRTDYVADVSGATASLHQIDDVCIDPNFIYLVWDIDLSYVDNSYGTNRNQGENFPWTKGHSFFDLAESDGQRLQILNVCGEDVVDIFMDYIDGPVGGGPSYGTPSGYGTDPFATETVRFLINGGDWTDFVYETSLTYNLNQLGFCSGGSCNASPPGDGTDLLVDSPPWANEDGFIPASPYGGWQYRAMYEMRIERSVFATPACLQGTPALIRTDPVELHASPSKIGTNVVGLVRSSSTIGDYVWLDADRDGTQDAGEPGLANVTVALYFDAEVDIPIIDGRLDMDRNGIIDANDDGTIEGRPIIDGRVDIDKNGLINTSDDGDIGLFDVIDGLIDVDGDGIAGETNGDDDGTLTGFADGRFEPDTPAIDGALDMNLDGVVDGADDGLLFGFSVIDGLLDLDGDGIAGETNGDDDGFVNTVRVIDGRLDIDDDMDVDAADDGLFGNVDGSPGATETTDSGGLYTFTQLGAGTYFVDVTDDNGILNGFSLTVGPQSETDPSGLIQLELEDEYLDADFGYAPSDLTKAVVGNYLWSDADNDGIQDGGESGIGGVTLDLVDNNTMAVIATTTTAADGSYYFFGVDPGDYYVDVTDTGGALAGYTLTVGPQSETDPSTAFHVDAGDAYLNADFGYFNPSLGAIGNQVWFDVNENQTFNTGEPGLGNVTLVLIRDTDGDGSRDPGEPIVASTVTNLSGVYSFPGLVLDDGDGDADYFVQVTDTRNVLGKYLEAIFLPLGSVANNTSKFQPYAAAISAGTPVNNTADFGYLLDNPLGLLGDRVWYDKDADGVQDPDEPGIENVRVLLYNDANKNGVIDPAKDVVIGVRRSDVNGNYFFQRLDFDNNGEGYIAVVSRFARYDIIDGQLDINPDGVIDASDDGTVDGISVIDGRLDLDGDGVIETNGQDTGFRSGLRIEHGYIDFDRDGDANETNGDDSRFGPLRNYVQTGDPDQLGVPCTVCDERGARILSTAATISLTVDFGYDTTGAFSIGDTVYHDLDGDGVQDAGEPGLQSVTLDLYRDVDGDGVLDFDEPLIAQAITDINGIYLFDGLVLDDYIIVISDNNSILVGYTQTQGSPFEPVDSGELSTQDKDFGFVRNKPATISNFVWEDLDGDGVQDGGEPGVRNVTVNLYNPGGDGMPGGGDDLLVKTTTTDASGLYSFSVPPGNYYVEIIRPSGYRITLQNTTTADLDSDPDTVSGQAAATTLIIGENDPTWDAGLYRPVTVGDRVWLDVDGDGVQDVGEPGIANVTLVLRDGGGTPVGTAISDSNGNYIFDQRIPNTYDVDLDQSTLPAGLTLSGGTDPSSASTLTSGQIVLTKDFGYTDDGSAIIGDFIWSDADGDGIQDPGETGIGGVTLDLIGAGPDGVFGTGDDTSATTTTAADGSYYFSGIAAGLYRVDVTDTGGVLTGYALSSGPHSSSDPTAPITVAAGDVYLDADFGYFQAGLGTIGDRVWSDADNDGFRDAGEAGIGGVSVSLVQDSNGNGVLDADEPIIATTYTAADGTYSFSGLSLDDGGGDGDADYLVVVTDVDAVLAGRTRTSGTAGVDDNSQVVPYPVALSAGTPSNSTADFGYNAPGVIGDRIWSDADGDGVQDTGEAGIGGVTVDLLGPGLDGMIGTGDDVVLDTTTTAADGSYLFTLLLPGDYRVVVTDTGGVLTGYTQTGDPDEAGSCTTCDGESTTTLAVGQSDLTRDFGYRNPALFDISGTVFEDFDRDGFHDDPPETGFPVVTLALWHDVDGNGVLDPAIDERITTTTSDGSGNYLFPDLPDDDYIVAVTDQGGVLIGYELTSGRDQIPVTLAGANVTDVDFGYVRDPGAGSIGDTVWLDVDPPGPDGPDGVQGPNEAGLPGVSLNLYADRDADGVFEPDAQIFGERIDMDGDGDADADDDGVTGGFAVIDGRIDINGDGVIDASDDGTWNGVTVIDGAVDLDGDGNDGDDTGTLNGDDGAPIATTTTDANGKYLFTNLAAGNFFVDIDETSLPDSTADGIPDLAETAYPAGVNPSAVIHLSEGERYEDADFGYLPRPGTAIVGDFVWYDADSDGRQDPGEVGIGGIDVTVTNDPNGFSTTVTTAANGFYLVTGLAPDAVNPYFAFFDSADIAVLGYNTTPTNTGFNSTYQVTLAAGDVITHLDWGFDGGIVGSIGDFVWFDLDGDGVQDAGETGIAGVTLNLLDNATGGVLASTATGATEVVAGCFDLDGDGIPGETNGDDSGVLNGIAVISGALDTDGDGDIDAGDGGTFANVPVIAGKLDLDNNGTADDDGTVSGYYLFSGVPLDQGYQVQVTDIGGILDGLQRSSALPGVLTPTAGTADLLTADFGYVPGNGSGALGTHVWHDLDGDGLREPGEPPFQGVTLALWHDVDASGTINTGDNLLRSAVTDANGFYELKGLPLGDYLIDLTDTAGVLAGFSKTAGTAGVDDNSQSDPYALTLTSGAPDNLTADFGFEDAAGSLEISGTVFIDADIDAALDYIDEDMDGAYDPAISPQGPDTTLETPVQGATMTLYRLINPRFLIGRTKTDANGFYRFANLPAGNYQVEVDTTATAAAGFLQTTQTATGGVEPAVLADFGDSDWTQPNSGNSRNNNFGFYDGGVTTTPVTLSYFSAAPNKDGQVAFEWRTATEIGHIGFHLWAEQDGGWQRLNEAIIPSRGADSIVQQTYRQRVSAGGARLFMLEDIDIQGQSRFHGPFELGVAGGRRHLASEPIDWAWIGAEHAHKKALRRKQQTKAGGSGVTLRLAEDGIYRVSFEELKANGLNVSGSKPKIALYNRGNPVPLRIDHQGRFVEFVGAAIDTLYTQTNVYTLTVDPGNAIVIAVDDTEPNPNAAAPAAYQEVRRSELDRSYSFSSPTGDPWFDTAILASTVPASRSFDLITDDRVSGGGPIHLTVGLWGVTNFPRDPDHHVVIEVNGVPMADETFDGLAEHPIRLEIPEGLLTGASDTFTIVLPGDTGVPFDLVNLDHHVVEYPRQFQARNGALEFTAAGEVLEVAGLTSPDVVVYRDDGSQRQLLSGVEVSGSGGSYRARIPGSIQPATYHLASGAAILSPQLERSRTTPEGFTHGQAQFLIISHPDFLDGLQPLVKARKKQGWKVKVVDVDDVYAVYSGGVFDPQAIREYIAVAAENMKTEAVLLVGGDTYDYHDYLGLGGMSFIPSLYAQTGEFIRYAPADGLYTDSNHDLVPELAIGRFPVRTSAELDVIVSRTLEFEAQFDRKSVVLAADDYDRPSRFDFTQASEQLAQFIPEDWQVDRAYIDTLGVAGARTELLARINAGAAVTSFEGHSGPTTWSFDGLFSATDATTLQNIGKPTVVTQWGCWTTYYVSPASETLAHKLLLSGDRGAAAVLGATTLTEARSERALGLGIFRRLFVPGATLGEVVLQAKRELAAQGHPAVIDVLLGWNLLGDPTLSGFGSVHQE